MNLQNINKRKAEKGFTIVELLIVIVVIGILAAIVIVAYIGVTNNARNARYNADAGSIQKVAEVYNTDEGEYPNTPAEFAAGSTTTKLPAGISINATESTGTVASPPTTASLQDNADDGIYSVNYCTGGLIIFYPAIGQTNAKSIAVGTTSSC